jgi:polyvinyl alcohol dehydrogenase (cytochrome)
VVWSSQLVDKVSPRLMTFGGAADDKTAYFGLRTGGIAAIDLVAGKKKWLTPIEQNPQAQAREGFTAAVTVIPGVVFAGGWDGSLHAFSTDDGHQLWQYDTLHDFKTVNEVPARGGSMGAPGPVVVGGMLFVGSGYTFGAGTTGNVLLAFSPQPE